MANALLGGLVAVSLVAVPLAVADSVAFGVGVALCGLAYGGVALVAAQLTASTRATYGLAGWSSRRRTGCVPSVTSATRR